MRRSNMVLLLLAAVLCFAAYLAPIQACAFAESLAESDQAAQIIVGQDVSITVDENRTTPYGWVVALSDETLLAQANDEYIPDPNPLGADGVGGKRRFTFTAVGVGQCAVDMYLVRIGDEVNEAIQTESYLYVISLAPGAPSGDTPENRSGAVEPGEIVQFGDYSWRVLEVRDDRALLITEEIIEANLYNLEPTAVTWEACFLRSSLNDRFLQCFTAEEQERIVETRLSNPDNRWYGTPGGADTDDKVFLLSLEEADRYFGDSGDYSNARRKSWGAGNGFEENDDGWALSNDQDSQRAAIFGAGPSWWWLRSPGGSDASAAAVDIGGSINVRGRDADTFHPDMGGVRPALWLSLK